MRKHRTWFASQCAQSPRVMLGKIFRSIGLWTQATRHYFPDRLPLSLA